MTIACACIVAIATCGRIMGTFAVNASIAAIVAKS